MRVHTVAFKAVAVTAQQDFFEILAPSTTGIVIHEWEVSQNTELGDAAEEQLLLTTNRGVGAVTSGSGGSSATAQQDDNDDTAPGATCEVNNTSKMATGSGTLEELSPHNWNVRTPITKVHTPETRPYVKPGDRWTLELETTPADSITMSGFVKFSEGKPT